MFENYKQKTEKPKSHSDNLKSLALGALAASSMNAMDIGAAFAKDLPPTLEQALQMKQVPMKDLSNIPKSFLADKENFKATGIDINGQSADINTFNKNGNMIIVVSGPNVNDLNVNGVNVKKYTKQAGGNEYFAGIYDSPRFATYYAQRDGKVYDGNKEFKSLTQTPDLSSKSIVKATDSSPFGYDSFSSPLLINGNLRGSGERIYEFKIPTGKKIIPQIKKIEGGHLLIEDIDALLDSETQFEGTILEFYFPKNLILNFGKLKELMKNMHDCKIVVHEDGLANEVGSDGTSYVAFKDRVLSESTLEYSKYVAKHNLGNKASAAKISTSNWENPEIYLKKAFKGNQYFQAFMDESTILNSYQGNKKEVKATNKSVEAEAVKASKPADYNPGMEDSSQSVKEKIFLEDYTVKARLMSAAEQAKYSNTVAVENMANTGRIKTGQYISLFINRPDLVEKHQAVIVMYRFASAKGFTKWDGLQRVRPSKPAVLNFPINKKTESGVTMQFKTFIVTDDIESKIIDESKPIINLYFDDAN